MNFFTDSAENKCVKLVLKHQPIRKSVKLWEGGYLAPPITIEVTGKEVTFKFSSYNNYKEYSNGGPLYQVKYYPTKSKVNFKK